MGLDIVLCSPTQYPTSDSGLQGPLGLPQWLASVTSSVKTDALPKRHSSNNTRSGAEVN